MGYKNLKFEVCRLLECEIGNGKTLKIKRTRISIGNRITTQNKETGFTNRDLQY